MKHIQVTQAVFLASLLATSSVYAQEYPASSFQPKVIYSTEAATSSAVPVATVSASPCETKTGQIAEVDAKYPASSFQPKVVFSSDAAR
jgi:hypothetical protein